MAKIQLKKADKPINRKKENLKKNEKKKILYGSWRRIYRPAR